MNSASITLSPAWAYQLDSGAAVATTTVTTGVYGPHVLAFWSKDASGTTQTVMKIPFFVDDDVVPAVVCNAAASYVTTATITMTATDNFHGSGVDCLCYRVDGGAYQVLSPASAAATKLLVSRLAKVQVAPTAIDPPVDPTQPAPHIDRGPCTSCHDLITVTPEPTSTPDPTSTPTPQGGLSKSSP